MQDGFIFYDTIAKNISMSDDIIDIQKLSYAAKIANCDDFVNKLPLKYNTVIGSNGRGLSQGQKQRILIARAIYKMPQYLFLDEATNSLDAYNERKITNNLATFMQGRTVFIVAHRLSTVMNADQILVLYNGEIIERGKHSELVDKKGYYYQLIKNQLELGN
jgi:ATP-binding cassette subfamily B protein